MKRSDIRFLAVPSWWPGGLGARRHPDFEFCECFTVVTLSGDRPATTTVITNPLRTEAKSLAAVNLLLIHFIDTVIVQNIGRLPMAALVMEGIHVYKGSGSQVSDAIDDFSRGLLSPLSLVERFEAPTPDSPADHDHPLDFPGEE